MKYHEQLKHPLWQKKRLEVMQDRYFECEWCGGKEEQLNVHHKFYRRGAMIWQYDSCELMCLCEKCHKEIHAADERLRRELGYTDVIKERIIGYSAHPNTSLLAYEEIEGALDEIGIPASNKVIDHFCRSGIKKHEIMSEIGYEKIKEIKKAVKELAESMLIQVLK